MPSNVIVDEGDLPHKADFGLARRLRDDSEMTCAGQVLARRASCRRNRRRADVRTSVLQATLAQKLTVNSLTNIARISEADCSCRRAVALAPKNFEVLRIRAIVQAKFAAAEGR